MSDAGAKVRYCFHGYRVRDCTYPSCPHAAREFDVPPRPTTDEEIAELPVLDPDVLKGNRIVGAVSGDAAVRESDRLLLDGLADRVLRIEGLLGLKPDLRHVGGSEFWIVQAEGSKGKRALAYWGPYPTPEEAAEWTGFEPHFGHVIVEVPV